MSALSFPGVDRLGVIGQRLPDHQVKAVAAHPQSGEWRDFPVRETGLLVASGPTVFATYLRNGIVAEGELVRDGWLDTGDIGRVDPEPAAAPKGVIEIDELPLTEVGKVCEVMRILSEAGVADGFRGISRAMPGLRLLDSDGDRCDRQRDRQRDRRERALRPGRRGEASRRPLHPRVRRRRQHRARRSRHPVPGSRLRRALAGGRHPRPETSSCGKGRTRCARAGGPRRT